MFAIPLHIWVEAILLLFGFVTTLLLVIEIIICFQDTRKNGVGYFGPLMIFFSEKRLLDILERDNFSIAHWRWVRPSEQVQIKAVQKWYYAINHIKNPSEKVKQLHNMLWEI